MTKLKMAFLGFGLIGGSIARTLKIKKEPVTVCVYTRRPNPDLDHGVHDGIINELHYDLSDWLKQCDLIFLCGPVLVNIELLGQIKPFLSSSQIITDVGSVKGNIHEEAKRLGLDDCFIGGHPMAGSEKTGFANSSTTLLENAYYLLTPTSMTSPAHLDLMKNLVDTLGSICVVLTPEKHDQVTAAISHVPHIIATSLVNMVRLSDDEDENMKHFAAGGFKDITRIASSSPEMWQNICLSNTASIHQFLQSFQQILADFDAKLLTQDETGLRDTFLEAGNYRDSIPAKKASVIERCYELFLDIADETGAIATIATLLASNGISIKNIGILHNREFAEGALRIEFYRETAKEQAQDLLSLHHYRVFNKQ